MRYKNIGTGELLFPTLSVSIMPGETKDIDADIKHPDLDRIEEVTQTAQTVETVEIPTEGVINNG